MSYLILLVMELVVIFMVLQIFYISVRFIDKQLTDHLIYF